METDKEKQPPSKSSSFVTRVGDDNPKVNDKNDIEDNNANKKDDNNDKKDNNNHQDSNHEQNPSGQNQNQDQDHDQKHEQDTKSQSPKNENDNDNDNGNPQPPPSGEHDQRGEVVGDNVEAQPDNKDVEDPTQVPPEEVDIPKPSPPDLGKVSEEIDQFISTLSSSTSDSAGAGVGVVASAGDGDGVVASAGDGDVQTIQPPEIPIFLEQFAVLIESKIAKYESSEGPMRWYHLTEEESASFLESIARVYKVYTSLWKFSSETNYASSINRIGSILERAISFLEEEFRQIMEDFLITDPEDNNNNNQEPKAKQLSSSSSTVQEAAENSLLPESESKPDLPNEFPGYSDSTISNLSRLANALISLGHEMECCQDYFISRRNSLESCLHKQGFEKLSIDDVQKMNWEAMEREISTWMRTFKQFSTVFFPAELKLAEAVFSNDHKSIIDSLFSSLSQGVLVQLLNFAEAVAMTKRSSEKLFKFLDTYETLRDFIPDISDLFPAQCLDELKTESSLIRGRLGETMIIIFGELETSIKADTGKTPVPGGAVHPLTRYIMNYLTVATEYKDTLEQVFREHQKIDRADSNSGSEFDCNNAHASSSNQRNEPVKQSPFVMQLSKVMELLDANLDAKSKLYKDSILSMIFLMNNGRYILQKIKGSPAINSLMGDPWSRKRSQDLRQYHTNYKRETWGKLLNCLAHEGLVVNGKVLKPVLKERFKSFNALFDEIHRTQSAWVVSDEQLQSELRVSISAIVIPAYRSFMGRFSQIFTPGRQTEKYIKYQPEDIETLIDELFDGNTAAQQGKRR